MYQRTPLIERLLQHAQHSKAAFHMPGHKLGKVFPEVIKQAFLQMDVTELFGTDDLHDPQGAIKEAQDEASRAFGAKETFFLVNGSTVGIMAAIFSVAQPGQKIIVGRDCHKSVIHAMMLSGIEPIFVFPHWEKNLGVYGAVLPNTIEDLLVQHPEAKAVFLTRPNYFGICSDIQAIAKLAQAKNVTVIVDEAHGAHFAFSEHLPETALSSGVDIVIQSAHKTLPALTQTALLHIGGNLANRAAIKEYLQMFQTSSPSYLFMASLDGARAWMEQQSRQQFHRLLEEIQHCRQTLQDLEEIVWLDASMLEFGTKDFTRIVLDVSKLGITGYEAESVLREMFGIYIEMADLQRIVFISTVADATKEFVLLKESLNYIYKHEKKSKPWQVISTRFEQAQQEITLQESFRAKGKMVPMKESIGRIVKQMVIPYPPGVPILCPGERITLHTVKWIEALLQKGGKVNGLSEGNRIEVI